jgi:hypothetical protein
MIPIVIIGSGIAGLACARRLVAAGQTPLLLDKGRGIGGRVATRRVADMQFDHGAHFVTAQNASFATSLGTLDAAGAVATWATGPDDRRKVGTPGMSALAKALGSGLDIRQNVQVSRIEQHPTGWALHLADHVLQAQRVVVTVPAPQIAGLLGPEHPLVAALHPVQMAPCLTLMAATTTPPPFALRQDPDDPLSWIAQDNSKPGRPQGTGALWVAQANQAFSQTHLEQDAAAIASAMLPLLCDRLGIPQDRVTHASAHRWRYARVTQALGQPFLAAPGGTLYLGGDWCLGARVEAAWDSGTAIANAILAQG